MLKVVEFLDYSSDYTYSPSHAQAVINTEEIVFAKAIAPENTRSSYSIVRIRFKDGTVLDVIGKPQDFIEIRSAE